VINMSNDEIVKGFFEILIVETKLCDRKIQLYEEIRNRFEYDGCLDTVLIALYNEQKRLNAFKTMCELFLSGENVDVAKEAIIGSEAFKVYIEESVR